MKRAADAWGLLPVILLAGCAPSGQSEPAAESVGPPPVQESVAVAFDPSLPPEEQLAQVMRDHPDRPVVLRNRDSQSGGWRLECYSPTYEVDRVYRSMEGPQSAAALMLGDANQAEPQVMWVTGYHARVVSADGAEQLSQEFMCHTNLDSKHTAVSIGHARAPRLFTLSQGQFDIDFPDGFALPLMSNEPLELWTQVLNLNGVDEPLKVKQHVQIDFVPQSEASRKFVPLMMTYAQVVVSLVGDQSPYLRKENGEICFEAPGISCAVGDHALFQRSDGVLSDDEGNEFTVHWVVPPGRHEFRRRQQGLPLLHFDSKIHYVAVHMHPFAESITLRDVTDDRVVYEAKAHGTETGIGLAKVDIYSSRQGIPVARDHEYEVVCVYNNTSDQDQDSMAVMFLYCEDKRYDETIAQRAQTYLRERKPEALSDELEAILTDDEHTPLPSESHALVGRAAPDFQLITHRSTKMSLRQYLQDGPLVLVFYNGYFCDHCVAQLFGLNEDLRLFYELGGQVVAVSGDPPIQTRKQFERYGEFRYPVLFDDGTAARAYGTLIDGQVDQLPRLLHGTFLIDHGGIVRWAQTGKEPFFDNRTLLKELAKLTGRG